MTDRIQGEGSDAWAIHERATRAQAHGEDVIILSIGDPDFDTPPAIVEAAIASLQAGRTHYSSAGGLWQIREALARYSSRLVGHDLGPENVVFFPGAQSALFAVAMCLLEAGDEVIVQEPTYVTYEGVVGSTGASIVRVPLRPEDGFHLRREDVERAITPRTRVLLVNNPHNPSGAVLKREEIEALGELCRRHGLWFVTDEVYAALTYNGEHISPVGLPGLADRSVVISSLSKSHAMTGWRHGWAVAPAELANHLVRLGICMLYGSPTFIQDAGIVAVSGTVPEVEAMRAAYARRAAIVVEMLSGVRGIIPHPPEAGMFVMLDVRGTGLDGKRFGERLFDEAGISSLPGIGFGPSFAGYVRLSLAVPEERLRDACRRIRAVVAGIMESETPVAARIG